MPGENSALGWIDVTVSPPVEKILSTNRGDVGMLGNRRALFVDHYNAQDGNGELVLVEVATGASQLLARAVTGVTVSWPGEKQKGRTSRTPSAVARGRRATGLWLTTLPP